ncbi:MAG: GntR family transcriptional regulator [Planctomycetes bacterium]|nr:GntR family transcriptional regulator [Planctomycetota bacterium]
MGVQQIDGSDRSQGKRKATKRRPLYSSVCDALRRRLISGEIPGGSRLPPLRNLASQFKVSTITVRQALRTLEEEGHLQCIAGVGVFVHAAAPRRPATQQITIGFATIEIESAFSMHIAHYLEEACQQRGWGVQLYNAQGDPELEARNLARLVNSGLNGAIILPVNDPKNFEALVQLKLGGFPFVLVDRAVPGLRVDLVESKHEQGAYMATRHLLDHGHRRVLMVTQQVDLEPVGARMRGYDRALLDAGIEPLRAWKVWLDDAATSRGGREGKRWWGAHQAIIPVLRSIDLPVAVFAHNAYSGWGVFEACRDLGLNVPDDVSIVCFDHAEFLRALTPPMTAIWQATDIIARTAVELLERRLAGDAAGEPEHIQIDVELVERGSVSRFGPRPAGQASR